MADPHKHEALAADGFVVRQVCATCTHWVSPTGRSTWSWGHCAIKVYPHAKHTEKKLAGTPALGWCGLYAGDLAKVSALVGDDYAARYAPEEAEPGWVCVGDDGCQCPRHIRKRTLKPIVTTDQRREFACHELEHQARVFPEGDPEARAVKEAMLRARGQQLGQG